MPEIKGKKRWEVAPCIVFPEDRNIEDVAVAIAIASVKKAGVFGLGATTQLFAALQDIDEIPPEAEQGLYEEVKKTGRIRIDYWQGKCTKLTLRIVESTIHISLNAWTDRLPGAPTNIPQQAVDELQEVLKLAQTLLKSKRERMGAENPEERPFKRMERLADSVNTLEGLGLGREKLRRLLTGKSEE